MASLSECSEECSFLFEAVYESSVDKLRSFTDRHSNEQILASFSQCNEKGENPLVVAIKGENVALIEVFVKSCQYFQCLIDEHHPFSSNALDILSRQFPIVKLVDLLVYHLDGFYDRYWLEFLAQVFIKSTSFTRQDKIIALELIGALLNMDLPFRFLHFYDQLSLGLQCWREAMKLRYFPAESEPLLPKTPYVPIPSVASSVVFQSTVEVLYMEGLDLLEGHFNRNYFTVDRDAVRQTCRLLMQRQSLIVIRRISSPSNSELPHILYLKSLMKFGTDFDIETNPGSSALVINTYLLILEQMTGCDPKLLSRQSFEFFLSTLRSISGYFMSMLRQPADSQGSQELSFDNLLAPTKFLGMIARFFPDPAMISSIEVGYRIDWQVEFEECFNFAELVFDFVFVFESISSRLSSQEKQQLEKCYSYYIQNLFPERTTTVLHAAIVVNDHGIFSNFRNVENFKPMIKLLLKLGADPNAINKYGKTPLHLLVGNEGFNLDENRSLFQAFVEAGTHIDIVADDGCTVLSYFEASQYDRCIVGPYYKSLINTVFPLSCYCARVIGRHGIRFDEDRLPLHLQAFVSRHGAKNSRFARYDVS